MTAEFKESLDAIRQKVTTHQTDFNKGEILHLALVYGEITKQSTGRARVLDIGCSSCVSSASAIVFNYINFTESKPIDIDKPIDHKEVNIVLKEVSGDELDDMSLQDLRELYPHIKSTSKAGFLTKIRSNVQ